MNQEFVGSVLATARKMQDQAYELWLPPEDGKPSSAQQVLRRNLVKDTRGYIERVVEQVNGTYEYGHYDACAVMIRRLIEMLIIEAFESHDLRDEIIDAHDEYISLNGLIKKTLDRRSWGLSRDTKSVLKNLRKSGNRSAHYRRYTARRTDIDNDKIELRVAVEEFVHLIKWR